MSGTACTEALAVNKKKNEFKNMQVKIMLAFPWCLVHLLRPLFFAFFCNRILFSIKKMKHKFVNVNYSMILMFFAIQFLQNWCFCHFSAIGFYFRSKKWISNLSKIEQKSSQNEKQNCHFMKKKIGKHVLI